MRKDEKVLVKKNSIKVITLLIFIFLIMLGLNFLTPLYYGDDLVYAFIWPNQFMNVPLPETAVRINSVMDILVSQWRHYHTGNGRTIAHFFVQFFVWQDKWLFNFINSFIFVLLILQIHWISDRGIISFKYLRASSICWIFFVLWTFVAGFWSVYLWLAGACNYLWSIVILLFFLIPYERNFFDGQSNISNTWEKQLLFFLLGLCAGWSNENTICWIILVLAIWLYKLFKLKRTEIWMICGFIGLCIGYALLVFAPGNSFKTKYYLENYFMNNWLIIYSAEYLKDRWFSFVTIEYLQILLWCFIFSSFWKLKKWKEMDKAIIKKYCVLVKLCCVLSVLFNLVMLLTPDFPLRSGFASLVFMTIASSLLIRTQNVTGKGFTVLNARKFLTVISCCVFMITLCGTYLGCYYNYEYDSNIKGMIQQHKESRSNTDILEIPENKQDLKVLNRISGLHLLQPILPEDENDWMNVAVARYYGIKGIKTRKSGVKNDK